MSDLNEQDIAEIIEKKEEPNSIEKDIIENLSEWSSLIMELSLKEVDLIKIKERIFDKEQWMTEQVDFKELYGKNNADIRKQHFKKFLKNEYATRNSLEVSIEYLKRRISFLKQLTHTKTVIMEVK